MNNIIRLVIVQTLLLITTLTAATTADVVIAPATLDLNGNPAVPNKEGVTGTYLDGTLTLSVEGTTIMLLQYKEGTSATKTATGASFVADVTKSYTVQIVTAAGTKLVGVTFTNVIADVTPVVDTPIITDDKVEINLEDDRKLEIEINEDIITTLQDDGSVKLEQTITNDDGSESKLDVVASKNNIALNVEVVINGEKLTTVSDIVSNAKQKINKDGSVVTEITNDKGIKSALTSDSKGETKVGVSSEKASSTFLTPPTSKIKLDKSGNAISKVKLPNANATFEANANTGNVRATIKMGNSVYKAECKSVDDATCDISLVEESTSTRAMYSKSYNAMKKHIESNRDYTIADRTEEAQGDVAPEIPTEEDYATVKPLENSIFEDVTAFDGKRYVVLVSGSAKINLFGNEEDMIIGKEYAIDPDMEDYILNSPTLFNNQLDIKIGWNLLALPYAIESDVMMSLLNDVSIMWTYVDGGWDKNPETIAPEHGIWVKSNIEETIKFAYADLYDVKYDTDKTGWQLVGTSQTVEDILSQDSSILVVWVYGDDGWIKNPDNIYQAQGFWIKR
jgi:hypothetical protein